MPPKVSKVTTSSKTPLKKPTNLKNPTTMKKSSKNLRGKSKKNKKISLHFSIDCTLPVEDGIMDIKSFETYLKERIKVSGILRTSNNYRNVVHVSRNGSKLLIVAEIPFSKRYLKYLTKKYLKKNSLRDWMRVISTNKENYELRYFQINADASSDGED